LKTGTKSACFQKVGEIRCDNLRLKINLRTVIRIPEQTFIMRAGMPSNPPDFDGPRCVAAL